MQKDKLPQCTNCWDKGYSTQMYGIHGAEDFGGDGFDIAPEVHKNYCTCPRGKALQKLTKEQ